jgi:hypothetical protein
MAHIQVAAIVILKSDELALCNLQTVISIASMRRNTLRY